MRRITVLSTVIALGLIVAMGRPIAQGNVAEIEQVKDNLYVIVGGGGMKDIVRRVMVGDALTPVDVLYPPSMIATAMELTALKFLSNAPISGEYILSSPLITPENAEQFYYPDSPF